MDPSLSTLQDDEFVRRVYGLTLRRDPEADVLAQTVTRLREGTLSRAEFTSAGVRYGERGEGASAVLCAELHPRTVGAVARERARRLRR
jgi:hypothetical protein